MPDVGDRVQMLSKSGTRQGVVRRVSGAMLTVEWDTGGQTTVIPAPGVMTVVGGARPARRAGTAPARTSVTKVSKGPAKKTTARKAPAKKATVAKRPAKKGTATKKGASKKGTATKKTATKKGASKKGTAKKRR